MSFSNAGSDSPAMSVVVGLGLATAGLVAGLAGPKIINKVMARLKPGGKFSGVRPDAWKSLTCSDHL